MRVRVGEDDKGSEGQSNSTSKIISLLLEGWNKWISTKPKG